MPRRPLSIDADLSITVDGAPVTVRGRGATLMVEVPRLRTFRQLADAAGATRTEWLDAALRHGDLTLEIRCDGTVLGRLGAGAQPNASARLLRLAQAEVHPARAARVAARHHPWAAALAGAGLAALLLWWRRR
ncbi:hypothetical protein [Salisaeta longa]|uniref:hypothetical protein n=1 Tax=Salisaeta longa TaxID=503170 RepID=UPI0003B6571B|nr:hypothetical protein [Salisaeta longa]